MYVRSIRRMRNISSFHITCMLVCRYVRSIAHVPQLLLPLTKGFFSLVSAYGRNPTPNAPLKPAISKKRRQRSLPTHQCKWAHPTKPNPIKPNHTNKIRSHHKFVISKLSSSSLTPKLRRPVRAFLQIVSADRRPRGLHGLDKVFENERGLEELVAVDVDPGHFDGLRVAGGAGGEFFFGRGGGGGGYLDGALEELNV